MGRETFYDEKQLAIIPMGFCYPGKGKGGDLPPRPECTETWRETLLAQLPNVALTVVMGRYAIDWHLKKGLRSPSLSDHRSQKMSSFYHTRRHAIFDGSGITPGLKTK